MTSLVKISPVVLKKKIFYDPTPFLYFCDYLPLEEDLTLYLNKLEFPSLKDNVYHVEFGLLVLEKKIFKNFQCIFTFLLLSPLGEGKSPSFEQT
jgi:hypothetical protein